MPREQQEAYLKSIRPVAFTSRTLTDKKAIRTMLNQIRETGLATTADDTHIGVSAFGTPVFARGGEVVAALVVAAPTERVAPQAAKMVSLLREHAHSLSRALGYVADEAAASGLRHHRAA
jgi:DNA-binding IclR family transcriptional regulator